MGYTIKRLIIEIALIAILYKFVIYNYFKGLTAFLLAVVAFFVAEVIARYILRD